MKRLIFAIKKDKPIIDVTQPQDVPSSTPVVFSGLLTNTVEFFDSQESKSE